MLMQQWESTLVDKQNAILERDKAWREQILERNRKFQHDSYINDQNNIKHELEK